MNIDRNKVAELVGDAAWGPRWILRSRKCWWPRRIWWEQVRDYPPRAPGSGTTPIHFKKV
ncbi:hypothetical protein ACM61V_02395 [Sphingomonas sp. TX0543]|uniref:hypothetical protein n=1 Tax=unclassified Sphingomonas TaxID=196159 RepID=UPI0010F562BB|nr:hypothetical protein [Sphingomonas sp. 3P27F8]